MSSADNHDRAFGVPADLVADAAQNQAFHARQTAPAHDDHDVGAVLGITNNLIGRVANGGFFLQIDWQVIIQHCPRLVKSPLGGGLRCGVYVSARHARSDAYRLDRGRWEPVQEAYGSAQRRRQVDSKPRYPAGAVGTVNPHQNFLDSLAHPTRSCATNDDISKYCASSEAGRS